MTLVFELFTHDFTFEIKTTGKPATCRRPVDCIPANAMKYTVTALKNSRNVWKILDWGLIKRALEGNLMLKIFFFLLRQSSGFRFSVWGSHIQGCKSLWHTKDVVLASSILLSICNRCTRLLDYIYWEDFKKKNLERRHPVKRRKNSLFYKREMSPLTSVLRYKNIQIFLSSELSVCHSLYFCSACHCFCQLLATESQVLCNTGKYMISLSK